MSDKLILDTIEKCNIHYELVFDSLDRCCKKCVFSSGLNDCDAFKECFIIKNDRLIEGYWRVKQYE